MNIKVSEVRNIADDACDKYTVLAYVTSREHVYNLVKFDDLWLGKGE
jgi:hypothetical protein